ncbi:PhoX domain-containing protein [Amanita rubescens]|nr:PhoX domain-containing protein [Amanita rubescens]
MSRFFSAPAVVFVGVLSVLLPFVFRILSSPWLLLVFSPLLLSFLLIAFIVFLVYLGHLLDATRRFSRANLIDAARPFAFSTPAAWQALTIRSQWSRNDRPTLSPLVPEAPQLSRALNDIISLIVRDFVQSWYQDISSSPSFPQAVTALIHQSLQKLRDRAEVADVPAFLVRRIVPKITAHVEQFRQSEIALRGADLERRLTQSDELDILLANKYAAEGKCIFRKLVDQILPFIFPENGAQSRALTIVVREILVCTVLYPVVDMLSDPDFWNQSIDRVAGAAIHQQKLISKIRNVLESQSPRIRQDNLGSTDTITIRTDMRQFESFLRSINRCASLLDARRLKNDIVGEIRRTRLLLANHENEDWINGERTEDVVAFLDRLYTAKRKVEERIVVLGGGDSPKQSTFTDAHPKSTLSLRDILRNPNSLSYFMEFMDRRHRSLLVQFWLTVESFKNPLESVDSDSSENENEPIQAASITSAVKEDISMIYELYFSTSNPALSFIPNKYADVIRDFAQNETNPSEASQRRVRRCVLLAQRQVERAMEQDFESFERSELWFRALGDAGFTDTVPVNEPQSPPVTVRGKRSMSSVLLPSNAPTPRGNSSLGSASVDSFPRSTPSNIEVLMSPVSDSAFETGRAPLFNDPEDEEQRAEEKRMEAIHAALTDIVALEESRPSDGSSLSLDQRKRKPVFDDEPEHDHGENFGEEDDKELAQEAFQLAGPGDLQLSHDIARLGEKILKLQRQDDMLAGLVKKAELTGDTQELRLLKKSKAAIQREMKQLQFQKTQYEQQETANRLISDRTRVSIVSSTTADEAGKSVVRYLIEVQQLAQDGSFSSGWVVARRYNEFLNMHTKLRERFALVRNLDFPGKRLVTSLSGSFLDNRKVALEKYLQSIVTIPLVCETEDLRSFLSRDSPFVAARHQETSGKAFPGTDLVRTVYRSVAESIDDMFFGPSMLDVMIQRLTRQAAEFAGVAGSRVNDEDYVAQALNAAGKIGPLLQLPGDLKPLEGETSTSTFSEPICDLILAVFELDKKNNWLRRQAIVILLQQVFGETIERKVRDKYKSFLTEPSIMPFVDLFRDSLWPGGQLVTPQPPRTAEDKTQTREEANKKLSSLVPDLAANMIGRSNARRGARRMFSVLQNRRLNQHIVYTILDEVIIALFPEASEVQAGVAP